MVIVAKRIGLAGAVLVVAMLFACTDGDEGPRAEREVTANPQGERVARAPAICSLKRVPDVRSEVNGVAYARGRGPVFVGLGTADIVHYTADTKEHNGWYYYKTLWAIAPEYGGAVTITGNQIAGPNELRFNAASGFPGEKLAELHVDSSERVVLGATETRAEHSEPDGGEWRYGPSATLIRADGCYAFRIEGEDFVEWVTFIARAKD